jgi:hypothetical protein
VSAGYSPGPQAARARGAAGLTTAALIRRRLGLTGRKRPPIITEAEAHKRAWSEKLPPGSAGACAAWFSHAEGNRMKAEHRKELQTNALADRIGRFFKNVKSGAQSSSAMVWVIAVLTVVLVVGAWLIFRKNARENRSEMWVTVDEAVSREPQALPRVFHTPSKDDPVQQSIDTLNDIIDKHPNTKAALMARFKLAQLYLRTLGLDKVATDPDIAMENLDKARIEFKKLEDEAQNDPYWKPQALLGIAQVMETMALKNAANLRKAQDLYKELADDYPDSAAGKEAAERVKLFKNQTRREEIEDFYGDLRKQLSFRLRRR